VSALKARSARSPTPLPLRRVPAKQEADQRRFAYPHRMMMVLADGKHFRAGPARKRVVAPFFLDDASRFGLGVVVDRGAVPARPARRPWQRREADRYSMNGSSR